MIKAEIVAHSVNKQGDELISVLATFPRPILSEMNTHRMLSKNTSSSRAIPFNKMVEAVQTNPFIPIAWQKNHSGMQGNEYHEETRHAISGWLRARDNAVKEATNLSTNCDVTKQLANRLLEPFMWTTMLITGSKEGWDNFFHLRCPQYYFEPEDKSYKSRKEWIDTWNGTFETGKDITRPAEVNDWDNFFWLKQNKGQAEIHMMALAEAIWDAKNESTPKLLKPGEWHIPFEDKIEAVMRNSDLEPYFQTDVFDLNDFINAEVGSGYRKMADALKVKSSTAMGARTSYTVVGEEKEINPKNLIGLHDKLVIQQPPHSSPMEHCNRAMTDDEHSRFVKGKSNLISNTMGIELIDNSDIKGWCYNIKGFIPYRYLIDNKLTL